MCVGGVRHTVGKISRRATSLLRPRPNRRSGREVMNPKVPRVQTGTISRLHFGSLGKKCHLDASAAERRREYYMGEGGGFPRVQAVVSQVSPRLLVACPNTKNVQNEF
jgi:hypothetical protein